MALNTNEAQQLLNKDIIVIRDTKANFYYFMRTTIELGKLIIYIISIVLIFNYYKN
jgi:hypothetical protein